MGGEENVEEGRKNDKEHNKTFNGEELLTNAQDEDTKLYIEMSKIMLLLVSFGLTCFADLFCWSAVR